MRSPNLFPPVFHGNLGCAQGFSPSALQARSGNSLPGDLVVFAVLVLQGYLLAIIYLIYFPHHLIFFFTGDISPIISIFNAKLCI